MIAHLHNIAQRAWSQASSVCIATPVKLKAPAARVPSAHMSHNWKQQVKPRMWFNLRSIAWQGRDVEPPTCTCAGPQVCTGAPHPLLPGGLNQLTPSVMNI